MELEEYEIMYEAEERHWWYRSLRSRIFFALTKYCPKNRSIKILDSGCGTGYNMICMDRYGISFGVDIAEEAIKCCKRRALRRVAKSSVMQLPFSNELFDVVLSIDVLYHDRICDDSQAISEMKRVLKKDGILFINVPAFNHLRRCHDSRVHTIRRYNARELMNKLNVNGFEVIKIDYWNMFLYPMALILSFADRIKKNSYKKSDLKRGSGFINIIFYHIAKLEQVFGKMINLPFGTSIFCVARKII